MWILGLVFTVFGVALIALGLGSDYYALAAAPGWLSAAVGGVILTRLILRPFRRRALLAAPIEAHLQTLARRRRQLVVQDAYGRDILGPWRKEVSHFVQTVFLPGLSKSERRLFSDGLAEIDQVVFRAIERRLRARDAGVVTFEAGMDPVAYEHFCADRLKAAGWRANPTQASGDQGVDVLAEAAGRRLVLQCKLYDRPVGNAAVQEIIAGRQFEDAEHAVVVSNAAYTKSARQLAAKSGVALLHHDELETYGRRLLA